MRPKLILTTAIVGAALALASVSSAAPPPPPTFQDSVSLTKAPAGPIPITELTATSGPSGENPTGEIRFGNGTPISDSGPITCLAVSGNTATFNYESQFLRTTVTAQVVDDSPDTFSIVAVLIAPTDCSPAPAPEATVIPLTSGNITVVDAQPPPTTMNQCSGDGWKQFGFKNQGQCIAFVNHNS